MRIAEQPFRTKAGAILNWHSLRRARRLFGLAIRLRFLRYRHSYRSHSFVRFPVKNATFCFTIIVVSLLSNRAICEVYFQDAHVEVSGSGLRASRTCTVVLKPQQSTGGAQAPLLTLSTSGTNRMSFGIKDPEQYEDVVVVQNNTRKALADEKFVLLEQFPGSIVGKALKSHRLFFVTAKYSRTGSYLSSRYDPLDFDELLEKVGLHCPFDVETLMSNLSGRERAERSLAISQSDLTLIRWALNKKYGSLSTEPAARSELTISDRNFLKRYAADNGLPLSQYLTWETSQKLKADGSEIARLSKPREEPASTVPVSEYFTFKVCNKGNIDVALATSHRTSSTDGRFKVEGWWIIDKHSCKEQTYLKGWFYFYAEQKKRGSRKYWAGKTSICVTYPGPFERISVSGYSCEASRLKRFIGKFIEMSQDEYTVNLND